MTTDIQAINEMEESFTEIEDGKPLRGAAQSADVEVLGVLRNDSDTVKMYDRRDGTSSKIKVYAGNDTINKTLSKTDPNPNSPTYGKRVFTSFSPEKRPDLFYNIRVPGIVPCLLNEHHPRYDEFKAMGYGPCPANKFINEQEAERHCKSAHLRFWPAFKEREERLERQTQRDEMKEILSVIAGLAQNNVQPTKSTGSK